MIKLNLNDVEIWVKQPPAPLTMETFTFDGTEWKQQMSDSDNGEMPKPQADIINKHNINISRIRNGDEIEIAFKANVTCMVHASLVDPTKQVLNIKPPFKMLTQPWGGPVVEVDSDDIIKAVDRPLEVGDIVNVLKWKSGNTCKIEFIKGTQATISMLEKDDLLYILRLADLVRV